MRTTIFLLSLFTMLSPIWCRAEAPKPTAADLLRYGNEGKVDDAPARRATAFQLDGWAGFLPRHSELKLGIAFVLEDGKALRPELQIADNIIGVGVGYKLPLSIFADALSISIGAGVDWDTARHEWTGSVYLAHLIF